MKNATVVDYKPKNEAVLDVKPQNKAVLEYKPKTDINIGEDSIRFYSLVLSQGMYIGVPGITYATTGTVDSSYSP